MRTILMTLSLAAVAAAALAAPGAKINNLTGDYVEARTASVFAGACHFNGELTTTGREAEMAWHIRDGAWNGTDLSGLNAVAAVVSEANLKDENAPRKTVLYISDKATPTQAKALASALEAKYGKTFGEVVAVKSAPVSFVNKADKFRIEVKGVTTLAVDALPNRECCKQPNLVWYNPLVELTDKRVGYTRESGIEDKTLNTAWSKSDQNTAFYGTFALGK